VGSATGLSEDVLLAVWENGKGKEVKTQNDGDTIAPQCWCIFQKSLFVANTGGMQEAGE